MALTCADFRRLLDEEAPLGPEAQRHLAECAACHRTLARWEQVRAKLQHWGEEDPPAFFHGRLMAHLRTSASQPARASLLRRAWWVPTLATALLVSVVFWRAPRPAPPSQALAPPQASGAPRAASPATAALTPTVPPLTPMAPPRREALGPLRGAQASPAAVTWCELAGPDGARRRLALAASEAPPPGTAWTIEVAPSGEVAPPSASRDAIPLDTLETLARLDLPAGSYVLTRAAPRRPAPR